MQHGLIYRRPNRPGGVWWAKYYHPSTFEPLRDSLNTTDEARANLLPRRLDLEIELVRPDIGSVGIPDTEGQKGLSTSL